MITPSYSGSLEVWDNNLQRIRRFSMVPVSPFLFVVEFVRHQLRFEDVAVGHLSLACFLGPRLSLFRGADSRKVEVWKNRRLCRETC